MCFFYQKKLHFLPKICYNTTPERGGISMNDFIEAYTKLRLKAGNDIIVTYHTSDGNTHTEEFTLVDTSYFSHITVATDTIKKNIPFLDPQTIIQSITFKGSNKPIYYNQYFNEYSFTNYSEFESNMKQMYRQIEYSLIQREKTIKRYFQRQTPLKFEELFFSQKQEEEFRTFFDYLISGLAEHARHKNLNDTLKFICAGTTSIIYEIGDKIVKIGKIRRMPTIPYCEFILQPIINRTYEFDGYPIHIEVTQKVFALDYDDGYVAESEDPRFEEIISNLSKQLYAIGLKFKDLHPGNVGVLLHDNKIHYNSINFETGSEEVTSIQNNNSLKINKKGNSVIIDLDDILIEDQEKYSLYLTSIGYHKTKARKPNILNNKR